MGTFRELIAYQKGFMLSMEIFKISMRFPKDEKYGLTSQIRRSSRSVCSNIAEAYRKRKYEAHFLSKLSDADMENTETKVWLDYSLECKYISDQEYNRLMEKADEVGRLLNYMMEHPEKFRWNP